MEKPPHQPIFVQTVNTSCIPNIYPNNQNQLILENSHATIPMPPNYILPPSVYPTRHPWIMQSFANYTNVDQQYQTPRPLSHSYPMLGTENFPYSIMITGPVYQPAHYPGGIVFSGSIPTNCGPTIATGSAANQIQIPIQPATILSVSQPLAITTINTRKIMKRKRHNAIPIINPSPNEKIKQVNNTKLEKSSSRSDNFNDSLSVSSFASLSGLSDSRSLLCLTSSDIDSNQIDLQQEETINNLQQNISDISSSSQNTDIKCPNKSVNTHTTSASVISEPISMVSGQKQHRNGCKEMNQLIETETSSQFSLSIPKKNLKNLENIELLPEENNIKHNENFLPNHICNGRSEATSSNEGINSSILNESVQKNIPNIETNDLPTEPSILCNNLILTEKKSEDEISNQKQKRYLKKKFKKMKSISNNSRNIVINNKNKKAYTDTKRKDNKKRFNHNDMKNDDIIINEKLIDKNENIIQNHIHKEYKKSTNQFQNNEYLLETDAFKNSSSEKDDDIIIKPPSTECSKISYDNETLLTLRKMAGSNSRPKINYLPNKLLKNLMPRYIIKNKQNNISIRNKINNNNLLFDNQVKRFSKQDLSDINKKLNSNEKDIIYEELLLDESISLKTAVNAWKPTNSILSQNEQSQEPDIKRKVCGILNKLTPENFNILIEQILNLNLDTPTKIYDVMILVFEKAIDEPNFSVSYAKLCSKLGLQLSKNSNDLLTNYDQNSLLEFRSKLLNKTQNEFTYNVVQYHQFKTNKLKSLIDEIDQCKDPNEKFELKANLEEKERKLRRRAVGTVKFIGELFKINMLTGNIIHKCIQILLDSNHEDKLEFLCKLITTVGCKFEKTLKNSNESCIFYDLNDIIIEMQNIVNENNNISSRIRFMLQDVIDLRKNLWISTHKDLNPQKMEQIQMEVENQKINQTTNYNLPANNNTSDTRSINSNKNVYSNINSENIKYNNYHKIDKNSEYQIDLSKFKLNNFDLDMSAKFGTRSQYIWKKDITLNYNLKPIETNTFVTLPDPVSIVDHNKNKNVIKDKKSNELHSNLALLKTKTDNSFFTLPKHYYSNFGNMKKSQVHNYSNPNKQYETVKILTRSQKSSNESNIGPNMEDTEKSSLNDEIQNSFNKLRTNDQEENERN